MEAHQTRVVDELAELETKRGNLGKFIGTNPVFKTLSVLDQTLLNQQYAIMLQYEEVLQQRINNFK